VDGGREDEGAVRAGTIGRQAGFDRLALLAFMRRWAGGATERVHNELTSQPAGCEQEESYDKWLEALKGYRHVEQSL